MKKLLFGAIAALVLTSCFNSAPSEVLISAYDVETIGTGFKTFAPAADLRVNAIQTPSGKWSVRVTVPLKKVSDEKVEALSTSLDLLDRSGVRLNAAFDLFGQDVMAILPVLNDDDKPVRNVSYMASAELDKKTVNNVIANAASVVLRLDATIAEAKKDAVQQKAEFPYNPTVQNLAAYYGIWGILRQYEAAYRRGNKSQCKQIKARLSKIEDAVNDHPRGGRKISNELEDWIDDRIDDIEDRVDDEK